MAGFVTKPDWLAYPDAEEFLPETNENWAVYYKRIDGLLYFKCDADARTVAKNWQPVANSESGQYTENEHRIIRRPQPKTVATECQGAGHDEVSWLDF